MPYRRTVGRRAQVRSVCTHGSLSPPVAPSRIYGRLTAQLRHIGCAETSQSVAPRTHSKPLRREGPDLTMPLTRSTTATLLGIGAAIAAVWFLRALELWEERFG